MRRTLLNVTGSAVVAGAVIAGGGPAWAATVTQVPAASAGAMGGFADAVAVSATDGWAVGGNGSGVIQRFNGARWNLTTIPDLLNGGANNWAYLAGVDATSAGNAFAVGQSTAATGGAKTAVALHWNGTAWSKQATPKPGGNDTELTAVKAFSANDAWAVGQQATPGSTFRNTLAMHYNGTAWSAVPTPSPGTRTNFVTGVDGVAGNDVWLAGYSLNLPYGNRFRESLIEHWNGTAWTQVSTPNNGSTYLYDVSAVSATDAWAVGYGSTGGAFVIRWNGTAWSSVAAPPLASLQSVAARSGTDVWVAGSDAAGAAALAHWDGATWTVTPVTASGGVATPTLGAVTLATASTEWVVGSQQDATTGQSSFLAYRVG
ncbi:hypothetical protein ODJ79_37995 [Actinoplanes sp. KI2]|uniref:hypothetical protein n=1 Tax=Actinoplanes sp. KI2 TaxID=2983315 RepID=UPI0021D6084B|nr:hypothetical protein [Actinoplanes sp. KI2]MCU7729543.1 hypothetical protein [Actinoplanes sp. KI2]